jgi:hypothetical protein
MEMSENKKHTNTNPREILWTLLGISNVQTANLKMEL